MRPVKKPSEPTFLYLSETLSQISQIGLVPGPSYSQAQGQVSFTKLSEGLTFPSSHRSKFRCNRASPQTPLPSPDSPRPVRYLGLSGCHSWSSPWFSPRSFKVNASCKAIEHRGKECGLWNKKFPVCILSLMHTRCEALGKLFNLSMLNFIIIKRECM